jgi:transglutaminase-like putative cysteine protease
MNQRRQVTLVAAAATLLATAPLATVYQTWTWSIDCLFAVAAVCGAALGTRALRAPVWAQLLSMAGALLIMLTWLFGTHALLGTIPTAGTFQHFTDLLSSAGTDINDYGVPVPDRAGLLFLTAMSVGLVAILVDLVSVNLRRPALAGFPMLAMYWIPVLVHPDSVSLIPFVVGACGFLWLLVTDNVDRVRRFGRRFTGEGRDVDLWEPSPLAAAGRRLAVAGVLLAVLLPLAVPGMTNGLLARFGTGGGPGLGPGTGPGNATVNLFSTLSGALNQTKQQDMVRLTTNDPKPNYLRFAIADRVTDGGFSFRAPTGGQSATGTLPNPTITGSGVSQHQYTASVTVVNLNMSLLPIYTQPTRIQKLDSSWLYDKGSGLLYSTRNNANGREYTFDYLHTDFEVSALRAARPLSADDPIQREDTQVPDVQFVDAKVAELTKNKTTDYDKVRALFDYFSSDNGFSYALSTETGTSGSDIVDFLTHKKGYCEQYASALAWLVRAAHIPARVAFGFTRGGNHQNETWTLTNYNLHAWTEVYFAGFGWLPFDATPSASIAGAVDPGWAPDPNAPDQNLVPNGIGPTGPAGSDPGALPGQNPNDPNAGNSVHGGGSHGQRATWPYWLLGSAGLVLLLLAAPAVSRSATRRRRQSRAARAGLLPAATTPAGDGASDVQVVPDGSPGAALAGGAAEAARWDAHAAWDELLDTMVDYRIPLDEAETPRVTAERVTRQLRLRDAAADGVLQLGHAEERARYARSPLPAAGLAGALRAARSAIARRANRWTRVRAVLLPPSVLRRWRMAGSDAFSGTVAVLGLRRDAALRAMRPRRRLSGRRPRAAAG